MKRSLIEIENVAEENSNVLLLSGDLGYNLFDSFEKRFPNRFINCGIMEQNMVGVAAGMAKEGKIPFVYSISTFLNMRALEQIKNDVCYENTNVKLVSAGAGLNYGNLGFSHHSISDLSCLLPLPNLTVFNPGDVIEGKKCIDEAVKIKGPVYIRIGRSAAPNGIVHTNNDFSVLGPVKVLDGEKICILSSGPLLYESFCAAKALHATLFSVPFINVMDGSAISKITSAFQTIITTEEGSIVGGFGSIVSQLLAKSSGKKRVLNIGIPEFSSYPIGDHEFLKNYFGLSTEGIISSIKRFIK